MCYCQCAGCLHSLYTSLTEKQGAHIDLSLISRGDGNCTSWPTCTSLLWFSLWLVSVYGWSLIEDPTWSVLLAAEECTHSSKCICIGWTNRPWDSDVLCCADREWECVLARTLVCVYLCVTKGQPLTLSWNHFSFSAYPLCCWYIINILHLHTGSEQRPASSSVFVLFKSHPLTKIWQIEPLWTWIL